MQERRAFFRSFFICLVLALFVLGLSQTNASTFLTGMMQQLIFPGQALVYASTHPSQTADSPDLKKAADQVALSQLKQDNQALHDQFATAAIPTKKLLPVAIIGMPGYVPYVSQPVSLVIAAGSDDHLSVGMVVVYKDSLIGKITQIASHRSVVPLISASGQSLTAKDAQTNAIGVVRGNQGGLALESVVLSDALHVGDIIVTKGDVDTKGNGYPPDLVIGKIASVAKQPSDLFQAASLKSLLDISKLSTVFVEIN